MSFKKYIEELKRRNVFKACLAYLLVAWLLIQVASIVLPTFNAPEYLLKSIVFITVIGFPINLIFAWIYDITPKGIQKTKNRNNSSSNLKNNKLNKTITGTLVLVITILLFKQFNSSAAKSEIVISENEIISTETILDKSIAVMPFADMSQGQDQEYFCDGMMEEILNHLFKIGDLKVISRTSSMQYKNSPKSMPERGKELGVAHILEGSVRKDGDRLRITVQLIDVDTDVHLWSENYDRDFEDVFAIQSEVAQKVARYLKAEISPETNEIITTALTTNTEAYKLYLEARVLDMFKKEDNSKAIKLYNQALKLDPNFSAVYMEIAASLQAANLMAVGEGMNALETWLISKPYVEMAIKTDNNNAFAHGRMGQSLLWFEWDIKGAEKSFLEVKRIIPSFVWTDLLILTGRINEALKGAANSVELDPRSMEGWTGLILSQYFAGKHNEVLTTIEKALLSNTSGGRPFLLSESSRVLMFLENYSEALNKINILKKEYPHIETPRLMAIECISYLHLKELKKSKTIENKLLAKSKINAGGSPFFHLAMIASQKGEIEEAFKWLNKAYKEHEVEMYWLKVEPPFKPLNNDPRWQKMLDKVGIP